MSAWWVGLPPAEATVACAGERHRLRWEAGALQALDHDDIDGERTMAALGGERCACVAAVDAWSRHAQNATVLLLAPRGSTDVLPGRERGPSGISAGFTVGAIGWTSYAPISNSLRSTPATGSFGAAEPDADTEILEFLNLGGGIGDRLVASVAAHWRDRADELRAPLHAALYGRLTCALRQWLAEADLGLELDQVAHGATRRLSRDGGVMRAALPYAWVPDVWARDMTIVAGRFVLDAVPSSDGRQWSLATIGPDLGSPETVSLTFPG